VAAQKICQVDHDEANIDVTAAQLALVVAMSHGARLTAPPIPFASFSPKVRDRLSQSLRRGLEERHGV